MAVTDDEPPLEPPGDPSPPRIHVFVAHDGNRRLLVDWLADAVDATVTSGQRPDEHVDLFVVDERGHRDNHATITDRKRDADPTYLPCLLVTERGDRADGDDTTNVDDVVQLPTGKAALAARIQTLIDERTRSVRVDEDRRLLREQNRRLRQFAGRLAHDLRNPLGIAKGYAETAQDTGDPTHFRYVSDALDRMHRLVEETLTLAKMGETAVDRTTVSLATAARDAWRHVDTDAATLAVETDHTLDADESRLVELLENCFRNSVEHAQSDHSPTIRVGSLARATDDATTPTGFYVEDDGPGIPAGDREQVFEVGYTTNADGTGFGLRIVREICDAHGWTATATEADTGGARFEVTGCDCDTDDADDDEPQDDAEPAA